MFHRRFVIIVAASVVAAGCGGRSNGGRDQPLTVKALSHATAAAATARFSHAETGQASNVAYEGVYDFAQHVGSALDDPAADRPRARTRFFDDAVYIDTAGEPSIDFPGGPCNGRRWFVLYV